MQSVLTEFHALIHPDLFKHPNMIKFLGMAWGSNPFSSSHRLPALMVEYAEHGTLSRLLQKEPALDFKLKHLLSLDVVRGLSALHQVGLVHGDVKLENILVCSSPDRKFVAKLSDFGFSFVVCVSACFIDDLCLYRTMTYNTWLNQSPDRETCHGVINF